MKKYKILAGFIAAIMCATTIPPLSETAFITSYAASEKLDAPSGFKAASTTKSSIKLTWNKVKGADAYRVYVFNSDTDEYESYKTVAGTECTVKALTAGKTYKFKVAALIKENGKYKVQNKSNKISVKTKSSSKTRTEPIEFVTPKAGTKSSTVLKNCGIANYSKMSSLSTDNETIYRGTVLYSGVKSILYLGFNKNDQLYMYMLVVPSSYSNYLSTLSAVQKELGNNYDLDYDSDYNLVYSWFYNHVLFRINYNFDDENTYISFGFSDYKS